MKKFKICIVIQDGAKRFGYATTTKEKSIRCVLRKLKQFAKKENVKIILYDVKELN